MLFLLFNTFLFLVNSMSVVTWISYINDEYVTSYFDTDDPTLERYCDKEISIIKDSNGIYYVLRISDKDRYEAFPIDIENDQYSKYKSMLNYKQECLIDRNLFLTTYNYGIIDKCI